jgi:hypothetical protein
LVLDAILIFFVSKIKINQINIIKITNFNKNINIKYWKLNI